MPTKPSRVSDVLAEVFKRGGMKRGIRRAEAVLLWPQVAGTEVARFTSAKSLQGGTLFIEVADSETAMHLTLQRQRFLDVYQAKFGVQEVREIRFRAGRPGSEAPPAEHHSAPADPKALAKLALELSQLELPEHLAQPTMKAAKAMLESRARRLAEGWRPCVLCGALSEGKLCATCTRYAQSLKVRRASQRLAAQPDQATPLLSDEEREVAIYLAKDYLRQKMQELLPQVLAEPTLKPYLTSVARCYLAHTLHKSLAEVEDTDFDRLDARVARVLGRWG